MAKATRVLSTPRRTASKIQTKKRAKAKRAAPRADAGLFAAIERYYDAVREYDIRLKIFSKVEFIEPRPRGWVSKERAYLRAMNHYGRVEREVIAIRAKTLDGLSMLVFQALRGWEFWFKPLGKTREQLAAMILRELK